MNPLESHHLYWGLISLAIGILGLVRHWPTWIVAVLGLIGLILVIDDCNQHWGNGNSIINRLFHWLWRKCFGDWWPFGGL